MIKYFLNEQYDVEESDAERSFGKGRIIFLAVDYSAEPLASWGGNSALWKEILQPSEQIDFSGVFAD